MDLRKIEELMEKYDMDYTKDISTFYKDVDDKYPIKISPHLFEILEKTNSSGIASQFLPSKYELVDKDGIGAFFSEEKEVSRRIYQKYPNRCIIYTSSHCFAHCRYCSRKEKWKEKINYSKTDFDFSLKHIEKSYEIEEIILTGGDALACQDHDLEYMIGALSRIDHIKVIRIGTRAFTLNPSRITDNLCSIVEKYEKLIFCTQFNHPDEFTSQTVTAIKKIQKTGIPILNQSVLLKGVNDNISTMRKLLSACTSNRVIPYYLFHCFKIEGAQHFRTDPLLGKNILDSLVGEIGGWWIPRYTLIPESTGIKVPLCHYGVVSEANKNLILKDFTGRDVPYH